MKLLTAVFAFSLMFSACSSNKNESSESSSEQEGTEMESGTAVESNASDLGGAGTRFESQSGLVIEMIQPGNGARPEQGDIVKVHYTGTLKADGTKFDSSVDKGEPIEFQVGVGQVIPGWDEGIMLLNKGAKAKLIIPAKLGYGDRQQGPIPPNSDLVFEVELIDIKPAPRPIAHEPFSYESAEMKTSPSGVKVYIIEKGTGPKGEAGKTAVVHYYGYLKDSGKKFDSSYERGEPFQVPLGGGRVIPGWEEGLAMLHVGDKATLVIPYNLAYGEQGYPGVIPPKADLVFDIEFLEMN